MNRPRFEKINDLYIDTKYQIFNSLYKMYAAVLPWNKHPVLKDLDAEKLDIMYRYHSGLKTIHYPIASDIEKYDNADYAAYYIYSMLSSNWKKDFEVLFSDFNFLDNVDIKNNKSEIGNDLTSDNNRVDESFESENNDSKSKKDNIETTIISSDKVNSDTSENESEIKNGESSSERFDSSVTDDNVFTFNPPQKTVTSSTGTEVFDLPVNDSQNSVVSDGRNSSHQNDNINRDKHTIVANNNESVVNNNDNINSNEVRTVNDKHNKNITDNRYKDYMYQHDETDNKVGRDGRFTPQKMSSEQLEINKNIFFERVFNSIDKLICIPCY